MSSKCGPFWMFQVKRRVPALMGFVGQSIGMSHGVGVLRAGLLAFHVCELKLQTCGGLVVLGGKVGEGKAGPLWPRECDSTLMKL